MQTALSERRICDKPGGIQARRGPTHEHGQETVAGIARELGVKATLLQTWRRNAAMESKAADAKGPISCKEENRRLRREKAPLREDREILKKSGRVPSRTTVSTNGGSCASARSLRGSISHDDRRDLWLFGPSGGFSKDVAFSAA